MRWCMQRWPLVTSGEVGSHQLSGIDSCYVCSEGLQPKQRQFSHPSEAGQQDSSVICKSHGRDSLSSVEQCDYPTMDMVPGERNNIISRASTGGGQLYSRHGIPDNSPISGMATPQRHIPGPDARGVSVRCGPVCITPESSTTSVHQLETRPLCDRDRCSTGAMDQVEGLRIPTICLDQQGSQEGLGGKVNNSPDSSGVGIAALVSNSAIHAGRLPNIVTNPQRSTDRHIRATSPINAGGSASISRSNKDIQQKAFLQKPHSCCFSGWSKGTNTAYQSAWKKSVSWCIPRNVDPFCVLSIPFWTS